MSSYPNPKSNKGSFLKSKTAHPSSSATSRNQHQSSWLTWTSDIHLVKKSTVFLLKMSQRCFSCQNINSVPVSVELAISSKYQQNPQIFEGSCNWPLEQTVQLAKCESHFHTQPIRFKLNLILVISVNYCQLQKLQIKLHLYNKQLRWNQTLSQKK